MAAAGAFRPAFSVVTERVSRLSSAASYVRTASRLFANASGKRMQVEVCPRRVCDPLTKCRRRPAKLIRLRPAAIDTEDAPCLRTCRRRRRSRRVREARARACGCRRRARGALRYRL